MQTIIYRDIALAILSGKDGLKALQRDKSPTPLQRDKSQTPLQKDKSPTPLQLLVKEMPGETLPQFNQYSLACTASVATFFWNLYDIREFHIPYVANCDIIYIVIT